MNKVKIIFIVAVIVLLSAIFYYYQFVKVPELNSKITDLTNQVADNQEIASWGKFVNSKYQYSFKYPSDWFLYDEDLADVKVQPYKEKFDSNPGPFADAVEIIVEKIKSTTELREYVNQLYSNMCEGHTKEEMMISGTQAIKIVGGEGMGCGDQIYLINNGYVFKFEPNLGDRDQFNKVIDTFRFIN